MRQLTFGLACCVAILSAGCNKSPQGNAPANGNAAQTAQAVEYFTIRAGPIAKAKLNAVSGNFQLLNASAANGIPSARLGGACIVFAAADLGLTQLASRSCTTNSECQDPGASAGYCDGQTHSCWARPKADPTGSILCNKGKVFDVNNLNPVPADPVDLGRFNIKAGAKMRVTACLNKGAPPFPPPGVPCAQVESADRIEVMGPVATVKP